ncbi:hypothetical protein [Ornithinimicrobium cerasi]|uniref:Uncharacterized protein n=1 Tax=Ornithinimicrobium cerasi TaxID=2248773 RepID=A0A285VU13_9MICO|nr:hypothetical protein [Ornithinimicrobium cerasi]SOC57532.1 hypothetical protein SAMN05421879_11363 [Ornithinimicrobium cerasi]SOC57620.1 hypothetical protein SAMN05421879_11442 [Ornithinimicrobium cerasi]
MGSETDNRGSVDAEHARPEGATDAEVEAAGTVSEALEKIERARGHLYSFHQLIGAADFALGDGADQLEASGHADLAARLREELIGLNVIAGRWSFQMVEDFDDHYWATARALERAVRDEVTGGRRHVYEAELKQQRRTHGRPGHEATPQDL